ncbi:amino acid permease [Paenibacillus marchantiophytorum]|uniref:Amino acid permease n=1 Tax=Paenibacillus marchantiophytorum TaxID=1619310 RepID=A0ABQ1FBJ9_9BACL|nr:DUF1796 family putative cysteine peptidase [Paenibacillus marchantiophytorum]GGA05447.1 amino acid permease [Paenibacillus marchantiophytorum]
MKLSEIKGSYDAFFSLGDSCFPAIQLEKNKLRPYAGVLDWMVSGDLSQVNRLLNNRFNSFMEFKNLKVVGEDYGPFNYIVRDETYHIDSAHDFSVKKNTIANLESYPEIKEKYDRRIERFLDKLETSRRLLFIRTGGNRKQVEELQMTLSKLVKHDFRILFGQYTDRENILETNWPIERVCTIELPNHDMLHGNDTLWKSIFSDIHYKDLVNE